MRNFQDTFETCKRSFISAFSIWMAVPLSCTLEAVSHPPMLKKLFPKISQNSQDVFKVFFYKVAGWNPATLLKKTL